MASPLRRSGLAQFLHALEFAEAAEEAPFEERLAAGEAEEGAARASLRGGLGVAEKHASQGVAAVVEFLPQFRGFGQQRMAFRGVGRAGGIHFGFDTDVAMQQLLRFAPQPLGLFRNQLG